MNPKYNFVNLGAVIDFSVCSMRKEKKNNVQ